LISSFGLERVFLLQTKAEFLLVHKKIVVMYQTDGWMNR